MNLFPILTVVATLATFPRIDAATGGRLLRKILHEDHLRCQNSRFLEHSVEVSIMVEDNQEQLQMDNLVGLVQEDKKGTHLALEETLLEDKEDFPMEGSVDQGKIRITEMEHKEDFPTEDSVDKGKIRIAEVEDKEVKIRPFPSGRGRYPFRGPDRLYAGGQGGYPSQGPRGPFAGGRRGYPFAQAGYSFQRRGGPSSKEQGGYPLERPKGPFPGGRGG
uniref:Uncharacterized protein n=1 Tax=Haemonchus placei TaxID=6290 RepID=A0A0N4WWD2_HAEPC